MDGTENRPVVHMLPVVNAAAARPFQGNRCGGAQAGSRYRYRHHVDTGTDDAVAIMMARCIRRWR
jgi:hypothetical protein